ncbi:MAG: ATP-binding protein, partial [bacterium]
ELQKTAERESHTIWEQYPGKRIRYKCIGGGGGKGQRVVTQPSETAAAVMDILAEQKVLEAGSNRNFLIELNLETTRHNEIQVVGNGEWAISLGGRDCSIQMREQKQLEFSLTDELLEVAAKATKNKKHAANLTKERDTLKAMERDGARFGQGVGLDNVSTFECIVEGFDHFFMEMNTRIQVEHGCSELAYKMRFTNPDDPTEFFEVERLIEAMVLLAKHGSKMPKPKRILRAISGAEVRVNAVNAALQPHAGGVIRGWSKALPFEHRDDQGIGTRNPDTGSFPYYNLAGAYDSNIALVLCDGKSRADNLERLAEILRRMELRG